MVGYLGQALMALLLLALSNAALVRKSVDQLTSEEILNLQKSLREVNDDTSNLGYAAIASYHGYPTQCKDGDRDIACCLHGSPVFPQWHRLYVVQMEQALKAKGLSIGVPYWDWTRPLNHLPELVSQQVFIDSEGGKARGNVWYQGDINIDGQVVHTARAVDDRLFQQVAPGENTQLFEMVLNALEYENYCQFEVQFEVAHNTIHYLVGGRHKYSMSHLEYTSYDPIFFLHHSNVDRILAVKLALLGPGAPQKGGVEFCDLKNSMTPMAPFSWDSNPIALTRDHSLPPQTLAHSTFGYSYDDLSLNGYSVEEIRALLKERQTYDRAFANFRLFGIGSSANVRVEVCVPSSDKLTGDYCEFAGDFFILGGAIEMAWAFIWPYYFEITKTVQNLGVALDGNYNVQARIFSVNGTELPSNLIPSPSVSFRPAVGKTDPPMAHGESEHGHEVHDGVSIRKDIDTLTREEVNDLRQALTKFQNDASVDGYQATAEFHGDPGKCPYPNAKNRLACCIHGMPTFPHWHRLFVVQVEDALRRRGAQIGIPYWDWTKPGTQIPALAAEETYVDPENGETVRNPFFGADVAFLNSGAKTSRDVSDSLNDVPEWGDHTNLFDQYLYALEQEDFCNFEVQFEVAHNLIHALVGGNTQFGLSSLSYSAFDPIFFLHHSNVDRIWAIWTALQQYRGKPYKAHCAQSYVNQPLKPFAFSSPLNNNEKTFSHSVPTNVYDYAEELGYDYDNLQFGGMGIAELDQYIKSTQKSKDRVFYGILLHGIKKAALATVYVKKPGVDTEYNAGQFALLGGPSEMEWRFDRNYRFEITKALEELGINFLSPFDVRLEMNEFDGTPIDVSQFPKSQLIFKRRDILPEAQIDEVTVRKNVDSLNAEEVLALRRALANLKEDSSIGGYQTLGRYHGTPLWCPAPDAEKKVACCLHGMPVFPHWHRLLTVQAENALRRHGFSGGLPYWDWTRPMTQLPDLVDSAKYSDPKSGQELDNPFYSGHIDDANADTVRSVRDDLFQQPPFGGYTDIAKQVLLALEQDDFCTFEVQYEIAHNFIHALVGGSEQFSMASLQYTAFDPIFFLHHSNTDRIWAIWQALQKYRGKPYNTANCAIGQLRNPLSPFSLTSDINPDPVTREHSVPFQVFDYQTNFHYEYDALEFNGLSVPQLARVLEQNKAGDRVFAGFMLHGIQQSALVKFYICKSDDDCNNYAGEFYVLGDVNEMAWSYDRLYKYEITDALAALGLRYNDRYSVRYEVLNLQGEDIGQPFPTPTVVKEDGTSQLYGQEYREAVTAASYVRRDLSTLNEGEVESLRAAFLSIQKDDTYANIAAFHGKPGLCELNGRKVACCVHGMATFPAWHRLYVEQVEEALLGRGSNVAVPYWDWTQPITELPKLINDATYFNSRTQKFEPNPFFSGKVLGEDAVTTRDPQPQLFNNDYFYQQTLFALEQTNFCDFEIQFELIHNALHSWLGGRAEYSFSSLDYTAFDPVFFLHHANTDRIWAIWQELQRYRGLPYNEADCAINLMRKPLQPFNNDDFNHGDATNRYSRPADTFDYRNHFQYEYDTLTFNHMTIPQLENLLHQRQESGRVFAGFLLHNIGASADVEIYICVPTGPRGKKNCGTRAGVFSVLGGQLEMPFVFDRLYKYDITRAVRDLGLRPDSGAKFDLKINIHAVNGSYLNPSLLPAPTVLYVPGSNERQEADGQVGNYLVRKNIASLSPQEELSLLKAMAALQADSSADGYQSIASFHAIPPLCPSPSASKRYACCLHGMATFPQWHRLYTVQVEDALRRHGSLVGIPYWDWSRQTDHLPGLLANPTYTDVYTGQTIDNPWYKAKIEFENSVTERDVQGDYLFKQGPHGFDTWLFNQALLALEQEDYCDFEIQFEITHNAVHSWLGGTKVHSMGHLHYASYDPAFYVHHSNTDRLWALWQALQKYRGLNPNEANCALEQMRVPLKPFSFGAPYNLNPKTKEFSKPEDTFEYEEHFNYNYDHLEFVGLDIPALDGFIKEKQEEDRVFAGFLLKGFGSSAFVNFDIVSNGKSFEGGYFTVLGGSAEMPWQFDRLFKYEITDQLIAANLRFDDNYSFNISVRLPDGTVLDSSLIPTPSVLFKSAQHDFKREHVAPNHVRRNLDTLEERDLQSLKAALRDLQHDNSNDGWASLASFHGSPAKCSTPANESVACCIHGMPTFPHWHRLFTLQVEQALRRHGSAIAIPYWDWTLPITDLPEIFTSQNYYDVWRDEVVNNPFARGYVPTEDVYTVRDIRPEIRNKNQAGDHSAIFDLVLSALEQTDYCDFEVQFEVMHNAIHFLVGGLQTYSLSSLEYSAYDPLFFIHHSFTDKIWAVWQELQTRRHLPANKADCALNYMSQPMRPFFFEGFNLNKFTMDHAVPNTVFDYEHLGYSYDDLSIGGYDLDGLEQVIADRQSKARVFAGFLLKGVKTSGSVVINICLRNNVCNYAGRFNLLGGPTEMAWAFDRLFTYDITSALEQSGINPEDVFDAEALFTLDIKVFDVEGHALPVSSVLPEPTIIYKAAVGASEEVSSSSSLAGVGVRKDVSTLSTSEIDNLREALRRVQADAGPNGFASIAAFHGEPAGCELNGRRIACCQHGMANFPQWHRLFVKQFEDALTAQGAMIGIPYWDWTTAFTALPSLVTEQENNPFYNFKIFNGEVTSRAPREQLFNDPEFGSESFFYRQALLAFEQTDYCDFEVQYEITHNAIHSWTGGRSPYGMSTLEFTAYDPLFLLHHSNADRQFAIWQALQKFRGLPYNNANCAIQKLREPMKPFSNLDNINPTTRANARAIDAFDYDRFNYQYDNLNFHGLTISELNDLLEKRKEEDRVFAEFLLAGFGGSGDVVFNLCSEEECAFAGTFAVLGGAIEMPWAFDRLFKYDVTNVFRKLNLRPDDVYHFEVKIVAVNGTELYPGLIRPPSVQFVPGVKGYYERVAAKTAKSSASLLRKDVNDLTLAEASNLRDALYKLQQDQGPNGFEAIAGYHGAPFKCPANGEDKYACCAHGMPVFPHWHRLHTVQFEQALKEHGALVGVPYWDWTAPINALPSLIGDSSNHNPFYKYHISFVNQDTTRDIQDSLFNPRTINGYNYLYYLALSTLEEDSFCDFEIQYEILHNEIHGLIGGHGTYSMSTLDYSAFDPLFMIHHSSIDRIWAIWQQLQKLRRKPFNSARCGGAIMEEPLQPFSYSQINTNDFTRMNSQPSKVFDYAHLGYEFDNLELNGHDVNDLNNIINRLRDQDRVYLAFNNCGKQGSFAFDVHFETAENNVVPLGRFYVLGGEREMPWCFERVFKYDVTEVLQANNVDIHKPVKIGGQLFRYDGEHVQNFTTYYATFIERPAGVDYDIINIPVMRNSSINPKTVVKKGTRVRFVTDGVETPMENLGSFTNFHFCNIPPFSYHSFPFGEVHALSPGDYFFVNRDVDLCNSGRKLQITVADE
ncbi:hemocyanin 2 [Aplysia californica]|uniref:Hemocyanin 2 n=1 Tax=Aplysia californica TaxID=6500 RepID=A0ABM1A1E8_APLCA|nr:hemocyanin 2 [Aplysia californica]